ncbi:MAG: type II toxin-antitoxin system VapC family toxin [Acidobacteriaceae bacterium]
MSNPRGVLLDTHVWVRLQMVTRPLSSEALKAIQKAAGSRSVYVPVISAWEIAMLKLRRRLELNMPAQQWVAEALDKPGIQMLPLSPEIAIEAAELPEPMHKDPADRLIVASALVEGLTLITSDKAILAFAKKTGMDCIRA